MCPVSAFETKSLHSRFGAEVVGVDFSAPVADGVVQEIRRLADQHGVLLFRNTAIFSDEDQLAFCRQLGPGQILGERAPRSNEARLAAGVTAVGNIGDDNEILPLDSRRKAFMRGNELWHTDSSYGPNRGAYSMLKAVEIPPDGVAPTEYADMRSAYNDLPEGVKRRLDGLSAVHSLPYSRELAGYHIDDSEQSRFPPTLQPLVISSARTGVHSLYLASHIARIDGVTEAESTALLAQLFEHATRPEYVYQHAWTTGDIVMWDNLATMHRATSFEDNRWRRDMHRVTTLEKSESS